MTNMRYGKVISVHVDYYLFLLQFKAVFLSLGEHFQVNLLLICSIWSLKCIWILGLGHLILEKNQQKGLFWNFFLYFPNVYIRTLTKNENVCENRKCSLVPKMQNKPVILLFALGFLTGGVCYLGKIPNNPVLPLMCSPF